MAETKPAAPAATPPTAAPPGAPTNVTPASIAGSAPSPTPTPVPPGRAANAPANLQAGTIREQIEKARLASSQRVVHALLDEALTRIDAGEPINGRPS